VYSAPNILILVGNLGGKRLLEMLRFRRKNNIKMGVNVTMWAGFTWVRVGIIVQLL
jgi:hypothetical protein